MNDETCDGWSMGSETEKAKQGRIGNWQQTFTGGMFWPLDPRPSEVRIEDIAHALSLICRFGGHCREFYSVAQHSVLVSSECVRYEGGEDPRVRLWALLHDAAEAYIGDMVRPLKRSEGLEAYSKIETAILNCILKRFGIDEPIMPTCVKRADDALCAAEARDLMADPPGMWNLPEEATPYRIVPMDPAGAERWFLARFAELTGWEIDPPNPGRREKMIAYRADEERLEMALREKKEAR